MHRSSNRLSGIGLALALAAAATGCASGGGTVKLSSSKMCVANGGTYNATAKTCSYVQKTLSTKQICEDQGGYWDPADICNYNP